MFEFHISRQARDRYQFKQSLFSFNGNVIFANFQAARQFTHQLNLQRDLASYPERAVKTGQINAMALIDEILHFVMDLYRREMNPTVMVQAYAWLEETVGKKELEQALREFVFEFPPVNVYNQAISTTEYLENSTGGIPNRLVALEEMLLLWLANKNTAFSPYQELFDDRRLDHETAYPYIIDGLYQFFENQPFFGPDQENLLSMLRSPAIAVPRSLSGQLDYIREHWAALLGQYLSRLLTSLDLIREEEKISFFGPGPIPIPVYDPQAAAGIGDRFSLDRDWMPRLVLMAKNIHVWLDQLSKQYQRSITRLDQIPDEELDRLAWRGFSGLWLIGLWKRSPASARIKQLCGNPEAISSAYSLAGYRIAEDLGGQEALDNLRQRAWQRGIRLASDMVPNHMGIDSPWVIEHPDWFLSLDTAPFPSYTFNGPNLSSDPRVSLFLEDHYYDRTDAAVVFKWVDNQSGKTRFLYHGNDGTSMPWNDTAQLNYLNPEAREAAIQTILEVARQFPIIRFDAAMTLTKRHFQRLWFPEPGSGGDIPTRSGHSMNKSEFDNLMPEEFWRQVVDRVAQAAPDTLLLAEAFWLMESYFVRTLGMHRVYNSAFMNLLRDEENARYRLVMKNTLEFDPEIMRRFVNFMNNPDERTAIDQFGKDDKYFGICTLMVTLPGLPMFGHGQIEGFAEKYGMEYKKAYWDEHADHTLVERHERQIFPLLHRRSLFAGVDHFLLYDFYNREGHVNEDVFAFSNGDGEQRALVVYHNRFASAGGWIRSSAGFSIKTENGRQLVQRTLGEGLNLRNEKNRFVLFRDAISGLQYILPNRVIVENGLYLELGAYEHHVFLDFEEVTDDASGSYRRLYEHLGNRGTPSVQEALQELILQPVREPFSQIVHPAFFRYLLDHRISAGQALLPSSLPAEAEAKMHHLLEGIRQVTGSPAAGESVIQETLAQLEILLNLPGSPGQYPFPFSEPFRNLIRFVDPSTAAAPGRWMVMLTWLFSHKLAAVATVQDYEIVSLKWMEEWRLFSLIEKTWQEMGLHGPDLSRLLIALRFLVKHHRWLQKSSGQPLIKLLETWLADEDIRQFLGVNLHQNILWFNKESFDEFLTWMMFGAILNSTRHSCFSADRMVENALRAGAIITRLLEAEEQSGFQVNRLLAATKEKPPANVLPLPGSQTPVSNAD